MSTEAKDMYELTAQGSLTASLSVVVSRIKRRFGLQDDTSMAVSAASSAVTVHSDPWDEDVFGRFNNDPSWADFPRWLREQYRTDETNNPQD